MKFEPGDIAACYGCDWTSCAISWGTASAFAPRHLRLGPSHVAILYEWRGEMLWGESTTLCSRPCLIQGRRVIGAQAHRPADRIGDYAASGGYVDLYRLLPFNRLSREESRLLTRVLLNDFIAPGVHYDIRGALLSGTRVFQLTRLFPGADLKQLFCSELVAAVVMRLNRLNHANPTRFNPARLLRELVRTGKYERVARLGGEGSEIRGQDSGARECA